MLYMQSTSCDDGSYKLIITFKVGTDLDFAQVLVQNRVAIAMSASSPGSAAAGGDHQESLHADAAGDQSHLTRWPL